MDYPHQIDFVWLTSDSEGKLAVLVTAGAGLVPPAVLSALTEDRNVEAELLSLARHATASLLVDIPNPQSFRDLAERGLFVYDWSDVHLPTSEATGVYHLVARPSQPLHIDDLPPALQPLADIGGMPCNFGEPFLVVREGV